MKTRWIFVFLIIGLFFISGQTGCEPPTQPGGVSNGEPSTVSTIDKEYTGPGIGISNIRIVPSLMEDRPFKVIVNLRNNGKAVDSDLKLWTPNIGLGVLTSPAEESVSFEDAKIENKFEPKKESIIFGEYVYLDLKKDVKTDLKLDIVSNYNVNIVPQKDICIATEEALTQCSRSEIISGMNLGNEASAVPITVQSVKKTYISSGDTAYLDLVISLIDVGQGKGINNYVNNFEVSLIDGTNFECSLGDRSPIVSAVIGVGENVDIRGIIECSAVINLGQEEQSSQLLISFDYDYLIKKTITLDIKAV